ncbi:uncharacterized protein LOC105197964 isoform X1 [Solenopsis invicta]|uniref:uncharacterized protein LOC105197964 isoform X1 n=1 Tax=Solenopsis invicta TaxID=13686 RepID=UPI00193CD681|nr:uncharacterized protein LOC105197964 isoform X1 [Solenopsis invicta]
MNFVGDVYYKLNRRLLLLVGLWPYEHSIYKYCQMIFCNIIVIFTSICQITKLISEIKKSAISQNIEIMLKFLSPIVVFLIYLIKYETFCIVAKKIKYLMDHVEEDWNMLKDKRELEILERYTYIGSMCTMGLTSTETLYVTYVQHACGMFEVASYRMAQAFNAKLLQDYTCEKQAIIICKRIIEAIRIHKRALEFSEFLWSTLAISYSILLIIGITSLIINLFCLFQAILFIKAIDQIITLSLFTVGHIIYLFLGNYVGQILIDHSAGIFQNIYCTQWQGTPLQAQQLLRIIMQRSMKSCKMDVGGMFTPSLEGFAALMSTTLSYFTVLWSVHK